MAGAWRVRISNQYQSAILAAKGSAVRRSGSAEEKEDLNRAAETREGLDRLAY